MNELKKITLPAAIAILSVAFVAASFMVSRHKGKSAKWVARKMRLGGLILSLTALLQACDPAQTAALTDGNPPWTCYMIAPGPKAATNQFYINTENDSVITLHLKAHNTIDGEIKEREAEEFSFAIYDAQDSLKQQDNILPNDGAYDEDSETFEIEIDKSLETGDYTIRFFAVKKEDQPTWSEQYFNLKIE